MKKGRVFKGLLLGAALWGAMTSAHADALLDNAKKLLAEKNPKAAYELLLPAQGERAGDPKYDYLLGIAALDSGKPTEAVFALERVLAVEPNNAQARAEIARAFFVMGERETAKQEFQTVRDAGVPESARATIDEYLQAISRAEAMAGTKFRAYLEATVGYDSNVNSGPGDRQIAVPAFGGAFFTLDPNSTELDDMFGSVGFGASVSHRLSDVWGVFAGANMKQRVHADETQFETRDLDANLGVVARMGANTFSLALQHAQLYVDYDRYRQSNGGVAQWHYDIDPATQFTAFGQYGRLHYPGADLRDAKRMVAGFALAHAYSMRYSPVLFASVYMGQEDEEEEGVPQLGHDLQGVRLGGEITFAEAWKAFASVSYETRRYGAEPPTSFFFGTTREDDQYDFRLGATYQPAARWYVVPQYGYTRNDSNIGFNDFDRHVVSVTVRREFE